MNEDEGEFGVLADMAADANEALIEVVSAAAAAAAAEGAGEEALEEIGAAYDELSMAVADLRQIAVNLSRRLHPRPARRAKGK